MAGTRPGFNEDVYDDIDNMRDRLARLERAVNSVNEGGIGATPYNIDIGTVSTLAPGSPATASIAPGTPNHLSLGIPQGAVGPTGSIGPAGPTGATGPAGTLNYVTAIPASPSDGDVISYAVDATNSINWVLRWRSAVSRWEWEGGSDIEVAIDTAQNATTGAYQDLATVGPSYTVPRAGRYRCVFEAQIGTGAGAQTPTLGLAVNGTVATDDEVQVTVPVNAYQYPVSRMRSKTLAANDVVKVMYKAQLNPASFARRTLRIRPVYLT